MVIPMYLKDPKDDKPSVSLTLLGVTFLPLLGIAVKLAIAGNVDPLTNLFYACTALYFGRRVTLTNKNQESKINEINPPSV